MDAKIDIPGLLRPAHLAMVTSLELVLKSEAQDTTMPISQSLHRILRTYDSSFPELDGSSPRADAFSTLLQILPCALPNLSYLDFSLQSLPNSLRGNDQESMKLSEANILRPFDDLVRKLASTMTEFNIAIPTSIYRSRFESDVRASRRFEASSVAFSADRVWRILPGQEEDGRLGYWIKQGIDDERYPFAHMTDS